MKLNIPIAQKFNTYIENICTSILKDLIDTQ